MKYDIYSKKCRNSAVHVLNVLYNYYINNIIMIIIHYNLYNNILSLINYISIIYVQQLLSFYYDIGRNGIGVCRIHCAIT